MSLRIGGRGVWRIGSPGSEAVRGRGRGGAVARTGKPGDGRIFVILVARSVRVRTGEEVM